MKLDGGSAGFSCTATHLAAGAELEHAVALRIGHPQAEHHGTLRVRVLLQLLAEPHAVEDVVAEHQGDVVAADEVLADQEGRRDAVRHGLLGVAEPAPPAGGRRRGAPRTAAAARGSR